MMVHVQHFLFSLSRDYVCDCCCLQYYMVPLVGAFLFVPFSGPTMVYYGKRRKYEKKRAVIGLVLGFSACGADMDDDADGDEEDMMMMMGWPGL